MRVYLSPSNQPENTYNGVATNERDNCRAIANKLKASLERQGIEVKIGLKGSDNVSESNAFNADLHLPIHTNAFNKKARGASVLVHSMAAGNLKYANPILNNLKAIVLKQDTGRGISVRSDLKELYGTKMVAIYIEVDFHDSPSGVDFLIAKRSEIAEAIARTIIEADGKEFAPKTAGEYTDDAVKLGLFPRNTVWDAPLTREEAAAIAVKLFNLCKRG